MLWKAADKLRGSMDAAAYKHFLLGLIFLKYVSDAAAQQREEIRVPAAARWDAIAAAAKSGSRGKTVGELVDGAMGEIERANEELRGVLPRMFSRSGVDERRLAELVDLIGKLGFGDQAGQARDLLGHVYEYCLGRFAAAEGRRGGEFYTPQSVVQLLVEVLEPAPGSRVYDPCCGSGGMFVQAEKFSQTHGGRPSGISVYGQELNQNTWRLAKMNLAIRGIGADLGPRWADTFHDDLHPGLQADVVMANPPFNISDWGGDKLLSDPRWVYGVPPAGNANFGWIQHMVSKLSRHGSAGIVLANGSMSSRQSGEGDIRRAMVQDDLVACIVALPSQLFRTAQIPACLWFLTRDKTPRGGGALKDRRGEVLFIDARSMGTLVDRTTRVLTRENVTKVAGTYHAWRGTGRPLAYEDEPGFCHSAELAEIKEHDYVLTPGRYVGAAGTRDSEEPIADRIERLAGELHSHFRESARLEREIRDRLGKLDD